ncbi:hypothetical protein ES703_117669 [subsurface metagenome]
MARECLKLVRALIVEFGLTPSSRSKVYVPKDGIEDDPLEKILRGN